MPVLLFFLLFFLYAPPLQAQIPTTPQTIKLGSFTPVPSKTPPPSPTFTPAPIPPGGENCRTERVRECKKSCNKPGGRCGTGGTGAALYWCERNVTVCAPANPPPQNPPAQNPPPQNPPPAIPTAVPTQPPQFNNSKIFFSQRDPRWRSYNPRTTGQLGPCGCGETVAAMIAARIFDKTANPSVGQYSPPKFWDYYEREHPGRCGSALEWHRNTMLAYGLSAVIHTYNSANRDASNNIIRNYLNNGYHVFLYFKRVSSYGHYVLVDSVVGNSIRVYDPYYMPGSSMPVPLESGALINSYITIK